MSARMTSSGAYLTQKSASDETRTKGRPKKQGLRIDLTASQGGTICR